MFGGGQQTSAVTDDSAVGSLLAGLGDNGSDSESDDVDADGGDGGERAEGEQEGVREEAVEQVEGVGRGEGAAGVDGCDMGRPPPIRRPSLDWLLQATLDETIGEGVTAEDGAPASTKGEEGSPTRESTPILESRHEQVSLWMNSRRGASLLGTTMGHLSLLSLFTTFRTLPSSSCP